MRFLALFAAIFFTFVFIALAIWIIYLVAKEFYKVAQAKGHPQKKYFWMCFLLGVVGYLLVIALPDRGNTPKAVSEELPEL